ncbi:amidohydrolase [Clostridia bacterium]|nr:amidohydrolase [Clostridia bacterium]
METVLKNVKILTMDAEKKCYNNAYLKWKNNKITAIGPMEEYLSTNQQADIEIDGEDGIVMPGCINGHTHLSMIPFRGLGDDSPDRLRKILLPLEQACLSKELIYHAARYGIAESLLCGVTTVVDMYYQEEEVAKAADELGIRGLFTETLIEKDLTSQGNAYGLSASLEEIHAFLKNWKNHPRITSSISLHSTYSCTEAFLQLGNQLSSDYGVPFTMHLAEMAYETEYFAKQGLSPVSYLKKIGILSERLLAAHCIQVDEQDLEDFQKYGVSVAHCIGANTKGAKGIAPLKQMLNLNIPVALGTDGPSSGNTIDMFTQMKLCANFHRNHVKERGAFTADKIVSLTTDQAAKAIKQDKEIGSLEIGKQADLLLISCEKANMFPIYDLPSTIVYNTMTQNVDSVFVAGECVVKKGELVHAKLKDLRENLKMAMEKQRFYEEAGKLVNITR